MAASALGPTPSTAATPQNPNPPAIVLSPEDTTRLRDAEAVLKAPHIMQNLLASGRRYKGILLPGLIFYSPNLSLEELHRSVAAQLGIMQHRLRTFSDSSSLAYRNHSAAERAIESDKLSRQISAIQELFAPVRLAFELFQSRTSGSTPTPSNPSVKTDL